MRWLALFFLVGCNGSSGSDGGADGTTPGTDGSGDDAATMQDAGGQDTGSGNTTCVVPKGGTMCGGYLWQCDETDDCAPGNSCCLNLEMMVVKGSTCTGFCQNPKLQLCAGNMECTGGFNCASSTCSGFVVKTCGGVPANLCK